MTIDLTFDIETTSLNPREGRAICIGTRRSQNTHHEFRCDEYNSEEELLKAFFLYIERFQPDRIIGYNTGFDVRFLFARAMRHDLNGRGFFRIPREDLQSIMKSVGYRYSRNSGGSLEDWSRFFFSEEKILEQEKVPELYNEGKIDEITEYCRKDVTVTYKLWQQVNQTIEGHGFRRVNAYG